MLVKLEQIDQAAKLEEAIKKTVLFEDADASKHIAGDAAGATNDKAISSAAVITLYNDLVKRITNIPSPITKLHTVLDITKWDKETHKQVVSNPAIKADSDILLSLPVGTADTVNIAFAEASIIAREQVDGSITLEYTGAAPKQSFFIDLCIM